MAIQIITRRGPKQMSQVDLDELRNRCSSTLVDLGTGDGAWPRRFAREHDNVLAIGVDSDRRALGEAAKMAERKPARGGAPNALYVAASAEQLPSELSGVADWVTIYFPWAALLQLILRGEEQIGRIVGGLAGPRARLSIVLNAEAVPDGFEQPTPAEVTKSLKEALGAVEFRITRSEWLSADEAPPTTWGGRLVKGSGRRMIGIDAMR